MKIYKEGELIMELMNSGIKKEIQEILKLRNELCNEEFVFYNPISDIEIKKWENEKKITIPEQYKDWLKFSNGAKLEGEFARFFGLEDLIVNMVDYEEPIVIIGSLIGDGEILAFSIRTGEILKILDANVSRFDSFKQYLLFLIDVL